VEGITRAGNYRISHPQKPGTRARWLAVNPVEGESDLAPIGEEELVKFFGTRNVKRLGYAELASEFARRREVFPLMAVVLFVAFVVEALGGALQSLRRTAAEGGERS